MKNKYSNKIKKKPIKNKKQVDWKWIIKITIIALIISFSFSLISEVLLVNLNVIFSILLLLFFIILGIIFDMIGISVTVADIATFNSMAAKNIKSAKVAIQLIKNAEKVSSFCNDVVGDICGIISGSVGVTLALNLSNKLNIDLLLPTLIITAIIASLTIGGKAIGKSMAINKSNIILYRFAKSISVFYKNKRK